MIYQFGVLFLVGTSMSITSAWKQCPSSCTLEYSPICGTDGITYDNQCDFLCNSGKATIKYKGECIPILQDIIRKHPLPRCDCSTVFQPVCATNGHTYKNACHLNCANYRVHENLQIAHLGRCVTKKREIDPQQVPSFMPVYKGLVARVRV